jgi:hypothetical protein
MSAADMFIMLTRQNPCAMYSSNTLSNAFHKGRPIIAAYMSYPMFLLRDDSFGYLI